MNPNRTIVYIKDFLDKKKGNTETVETHTALDLIKQGYADIKEKKTQKTGQIKPEEKGFLPMRNYYYWEKLKKDKRFIVEELLLPQTTNMLFSPPEQYKSLLAMHLGLCISMGKPFLGLKTKKNAVLLCDKENSRQIIKNRLMAMRKGLNLHSKRFPLYILAGEGALDELNWVDTLKKTVQHYNIRLVIFDTLHRFSDYEENQADDLNRLYTTVFQPLVSELDCSVLFLHHTTKDGQYRGSSDFLGMVDTAYSIHKTTLNRENTRFKLTCEKSRWAGTEPIFGEFNFEEDSISLVKIPEAHLRAEEIGKISVLKEVTLLIKKMFPIQSTILSKKEILDDFEAKGLDYSIDSVKRALRWLVRNEYLERVSRGKYKRLWLEDS